MCRHKLQNGEGVLPMARTGDRWSDLFFTEYSSHNATLRVDRVLLYHPHFLLYSFTPLSFPHPPPPFFFAWRMNGQRAFPSLIVLALPTAGLQGQRASGKHLSVFDSFIRQQQNNKNAPPSRTCSHCFPKMRACPINRQQPVQWRVNNRTLSV